MQKDLLLTDAQTRSEKSRSLATVLYFILCPSSELLYRFYHAADFQTILQTNLHLRKSNLIQIRGHKKHFSSSLLKIPHFTDMAPYKPEDRQSLPLSSGHFCEQHKRYVSAPYIFCRICGVN